jgi:hypothetical protein
VTMTAAVFSSFWAWNRVSMTRSPFCVSRAPVGSSHRSSGGSFAKARAVVEPVLEPEAGEQLDGPALRGELLLSRELNRQRDVLQDPWLAVLAVPQGAQLLLASRMLLPAEVS